MKKTHINASPNPDGTRNVTWLCDREGWMPKGKLMPEIVNHVAEQPTALAKKMLQARNDEVRRTMFHA